MAGSGLSFCLFAQGAAVYWPNCGWQKERPDSYAARDPYAARVYRYGLGVTSLPTAEPEGEGHEHNGEHSHSHAEHLEGEIDSADHPAATAN